MRLFLARGGGERGWGRKGRGGETGEYRTCILKHVPAAFASPTLSVLEYTCRLPFRLHRPTPPNTEEMFLGNPAINDDITVKGFHGNSEGYDIRTTI